MMIGKGLDPGIVIQQSCIHRLAMGHTAQKVFSGLLHMKCSSKTAVTTEQLSIANVLKITRLEPE